MHYYREKALVAYTIFSSVVGSGWMGYKLLSFTFPPAKIHCDECKQTIMVSGCN